jgi:hypothetical protein
MLPNAGGFSFVAFPADYRASGVMTFLVNQKGVIYERDLGDKTADIAEHMSSSDPDKTWRVVK